MLDKNGKALATGSSASRGIAPGRSSSYGLSRLIHQYKERGRLAYQQTGWNGTIDLVPLLSFSYQQLHVEFKIGASKKYVLKNIVAFADAMRRGNFVSYGEELEFAHTPEVFTKRGKALAEFLLMEADSQSRGKQVGSHYGKNGNRYVEIHSGNMDEFFLALGDGEFQVEMDYNPGQPWRVSEEPCQPILVIQGQEDGALLEPEDIFYTFGGKFAYLWKDRQIHREPLEHAREIRPFWEYASNYKYSECFVSKAELPAFCQELLPVLVEAFQQGEAPVFCISLKAGGTGLNLTAADIVIHYDPWWNVAVQNQATDRAHRIGQKNLVTVYKLVAKGTVEESILKLQEKKSALAEQLLGNEGFEGVKFTKEELLALLG